MKNANIKLLIYEAVMAILALVAVAVLYLEFSRELTTTQEMIFARIDLAILVIFAMDYFYRLFRTREKRAFFKNNIFDLIAIIPFDKTFRVVRLFRTIRLLRIARLGRVTRLAKLSRVAVLFNDLF